MQGNFLGAQMLLDCERVVGAALDRRIIRSDHDLAPVNSPNARDDPSGRGITVVHSEGRQRRELQEGRTRVEQGVNAVASQELSALDVPGATDLRTSD